MRAFDVYNATIEWGGCIDMRPWIIVEMRSNGFVGCVPVSSECYDGGCFEISASHPDFQATGLAKSCYVHDFHVFNGSIGIFRKHRGELTNDLLVEFREATGF